MACPLGAELDKGSVGGASAGDPAGGYCTGPQLPRITTPQNHNGHFVKPGTYLIYQWPLTHEPLHFNVMPFHAVAELE